VMQLVERGKIGLDDCVLQYVKLKPILAPNVKPDERWENITIRHCLQHTGGWDRDRKAGYDPIAIPGRIEREMKLNRAPTPEDIVRYMMGRPLDFDPGGRYAYSNLGYLVLGRAIEAVTGAHYEAWVKQHVLSPIGITTAQLGHGLPENRAKGEVSYYDSKRRTGSCLYPPKVGERVPLPDGANNIEGYEAHGGWIASAVDLVRFASSFESGKKSPLLSAKSIKEMWGRPAGPAGTNDRGEPRPAYYACGWNVRPASMHGNVTAWHTGLIPATSTLMVRRYDGLAWAVLFNTEADAEGKTLSNLIDRPMHDATTAMTKWPEVDLFGKFHSGT